MNLSGFRKVYVYEIQNEILCIYVIAIRKRDDMEVYKKASIRV